MLGVAPEGSGRLLGALIILLLWIEGRIVFRVGTAGAMIYVDYLSLGRNRVVYPASQVNINAGFKVNKLELPREGWRRSSVILHRSEAQAFLELLQRAGTRLSND